MTFREIVFAFFKLKTSQKYKITTDLNLLKDDDLKLPDVLKYKKALSRAKEYGKLTELEKAIMQCRCDEVSMIGVEIKEDMSQYGRLSVIQDNEGDIHVTIIPCFEKEPDLLPVSVEFCNSGGQSPKTRAVLIELMKAMIEDGGKCIT